MSIAKRADLWAQRHPAAALAFISLAALAAMTADSWF